MLSHTRTHPHARRWIVNGTDLFTLDTTPRRVAAGVLVLLTSGALALGQSP